MHATSRKGFEKVRTGCFTCKRRRVKCDEAKPRCRRCRSTGRECGGYSQPPPGSYSWNKLLQAQPSTMLTTGMTSVELRGLDYFRCVVAPALSGVVNRQFWTSSALQVASINEPARFALLALSSLHENFKTQVRDQRAANDRQESISNYNKALKCISSTKNLEPNAALVTSVLFICIEFLRGNSQVAIDHCRHSIHILNSHGGTPELFALFRHLSIFPFFFGANLSNFPLLRGGVAPNHIQTLSQACETLDGLMSQCVRLVRSFDPWRLGLSHSNIPLHLSQIQGNLCESLRKFLLGLNKIRSAHKLDKDEASVFRMLEIRWLVCYIWSNLALNWHETCYDAYLNEFKHIVVLAQEEACHTERLKDLQTDHFAFEMGLAPLLHYVVMKCRLLSLRLEGLTLLKTLSYYRESSWDSRILYGIGKRMIEREHGIEITPQLLAANPEGVESNAILPQDIERIRDSYLEGNELDYLDLNGIQVARWAICFLMLDPDEERPACKIVRDWVDLVPRS